MTEKEERLKADPSIAVFDLENALDKYFLASGLRDFQVVIERIKAMHTTWSSAPKVLFQPHPSTP